MQYYSYSVDVQDNNPLDLRDELLDATFKRTIFDADRIICEDQIKTAVFRADRAFEQGNNIANIWGIEVLIHLTAQHQINIALDTVGISPKTTKIGIVQSEDVKPHPLAENTLDIHRPDESLLALYGLNSDDPCFDIISKGAILIADHE